jgi:TonB family protein
MKKTIISVSLLLIMSGAFAQEKGETGKGKVKAGFGVTVVQEQAEFPGGPDSLQSYLTRNLTYPEKSKMDKVSGRVYVSFAISMTGEILNPKVISGISEELDNEALRVVKGMPSWKPGTAGGSPVKVEYILPIDFVLPKGKN